MPLPTKVQPARRISRALTLVLALATTTWIAHAQTFSVLHSFSGGGDGAAPMSALTIDQAGNFYGTASGGGIFSPGGTAFKLKRSGSRWTLNPLFEFAEDDEGGANPLAGLIFGTDGSLYGTNSQGGLTGSGVVYKLQPPPTACKSVLCYWSFGFIYAFGAPGADRSFPGAENDGKYPSGNLAVDSANHFYGTTQAGGDFSAGTVFEMARIRGDWTETVLYDFAGGQDGSQPSDGVVLDSAGNLYGTTPFGGSQNCQGGCGIVFQLTLTNGIWVEHVLYRFQGGADGQNPYAGLAIDAAGNLYGATYKGGTNQGGTVFELTPSGGSWTHTVLYNLAGSGNGPYGRLTRDSAGNLYGTTVMPSTLFKLTHSGGGWTYTDLHDFTTSDGQSPRSAVTLDPQGNIYGTASMGGANSQGTIWEFAP